MWCVIIVHIFESIFLFIEVQLVSYDICVNVLMIMEVVVLSLHNSFASQNGECLHEHSLMMRKVFLEYGISGFQLSLNY